MCTEFRDRTILHAQYNIREFRQVGKAMGQEYHGLALSTDDQKAEHRPLHQVQS